MKRLSILTHLSLAAVLVTAASCGGSGAEASTPTEHLQAAMEQVKAGDSAAAVEHFDAALAALGDDTASPLYKQALLAKVDALAKDDPSSASVAFVEALEAAPEAFNATDYGKAANSIADGGSFQTALDMLEAAKKQFPEANDVDGMVVAMKARAEAEGDPAELELLRSLGYL